MLCALQVYALSRTADKEAEARGFGASGFVNTEDATQLAALGGSFDVILLTASGRAPLDPYLALLEPRGKLVCVSRPGKEGGGSPMHSVPCTQPTLTLALSIGLTR